MYYQNVFDSEFVGVLVLGDRQLSLNFRIKGNTNTSVNMIAWNREPYNLTGGNANLTFNYSFDSGSTWTPLVIDVSTSAAATSAALCSEIALALNGNATFSALYTASVITDPRSGNYLKVMANRSREKWKTYVTNTSAESILRFNKKAGVGELPTYFARHTISNVGNYDDSVGMLVQLTTSGADINIITDAGFDYTTVRNDWELLDGRSGIFNFQKITVDGSDRITQIIEYPAGAGIGDLGRLIGYTYTGANKNPNQITEIPYTLTSGSLVTPP